MDEENQSESDAQQNRRSKVGLLIEAYGLDGMSIKLAQYWKGEGVERHSLRELANHFNRALVRTAMVDAGLNPLDGEAENTYSLLTEDETTSGARRKVERRLEREGIDVDQLRRDFVSHQAVYTYLTDVCGLNYEPEDRGGDIEGSTETVQRLVGRMRSVSETVVGGLDQAGRITIGEYDITADVQITCRDCTTQYDLIEFLRRGHCECEE